MDLYWEDKYNDDKNWSYLEIEVNSPKKPSLRLESGSKGKFRLINQEVPILWGRVEIDWYGAWILRNKNEWKLENMIVPPISSANIESISFKNKEEKLRKWSRYFASALHQSNNSPLFEGTWHISNSDEDDTFEPSRNFPKWKVYNIDQALKNGNPTFIDWGISGSYDLLSIKDSPLHDSGRVKWFKKLVDINKCPPVLVWYLNCFDAYIIIDGHCRLKAFLDVETKPEILVLSTIQKYNIEIDKNRQKHIFEALKNRRLDSTKKPIPIEKVNKLLIDAFDNRPMISAITKSKGVYHLEEKWDEEVKEFLTQPNIDTEELEAMLMDYH